MRNPQRIKPILERIEEIWKKHPDLRLGQIMANLDSCSLYYIEDDELADSLERLYNKEGNYDAN